MRVLLLGGTDFTLAIAQRLAKLGLGPAGVVHVGETVRISYAPQGLSNVRHADIAGWCAGGGYRCPLHRHKEHARGD